MGIFIIFGKLAIIFGFGLAGGAPIGPVGPEMAFGLMFCCLLVKSDSLLMRTCSVLSDEALDCLFSC